MMHHKQILLSFFSPNERAHFELGHHKNQITERSKGNILSFNEHLRPLYLHKDLTS